MIGERDRADGSLELGRSFKAAMAAVRRLRGRDTQRPGELGYAQYALLFELGARGELSSRELACATELSAATVTQMLDSLAAAGLVARVRSGHDKRVVLSSLSERGRSVVEQRRAHFEPRWRAALAEFTDDELRTAAAVLDRVGAMFGDFAEYQADCARDGIAAGGPQPAAARRGPAASR